MKRVLVVDDDQWLAEVMAYRLSRDGFEVRVVSDALQAMTAIDEWQPKVIVLDIFMPGPNGIVLLQELQSHSDLAQIPVIVCSTSAGDMTLQQLRAYGVCDLLDKTTMTPTEMAAAVRKAIAT